ncbi:MAG: glycosyl hydrolase family 28-related protein, partial [Solirubrobacteraceae bacterium]|nr:glycosyl hydrolase family 28-related protein [Solirubrobacteraceae bacterium]
HTTLRQITTSKAARDVHRPAAAGAVCEGVYRGDVRQQGATPSWALPIKRAPEPAMLDAPATWANVQAYGAVADGVTDSSAAIRQAVNSGASTVYFPHGQYVVNDTVEVPSSVRRIEGMMSTITVNRYNSAPFWLGGGILKVTRAGDPLMIQRLNFDMTGKGGKLAIEYRGSATLILRDVVGAGLTLVDRSNTGGELFGDNLIAASMKFAGTSGIWLRQFDSEGSGVRIANAGAPLWLLGLKTEQNATAVANSAGAVTEVLGGLLYMVNPTTTPRPAFTNDSSQLFAAYVEEAFLPAATYAVQLQDTTPLEEFSILSTSQPSRGVGRTVPALSSD